MPSTRKNKKKGGVTLTPLPPTDHINNSVDTLYRTYNSDYNLVISNLLDLRKELDILTKYKAPPEILNKINQLINVFHQIFNKMRNSGYSRTFSIQSSLSFTTNSLAIDIPNDKKNKIITILNNLGTAANRINSNTLNILENTNNDRYLTALTFFEMSSSIVGELLQSTVFNVHLTPATPAPRPAPRHAP